ncbi:MAG: hypothetical protein IPJ76_11820 [Flavobacteriales bacterium]|nr:MAG: hypothetical protein IPJ76_11820 [Flavobacteriales bacterium]
MPLATALVALGPALSAQNAWSPMQPPFNYVGYMYNINADTIGDALYFHAVVSVVGNTFPDHAVAVYKNGQWDTLGLFANQTTDVIRWHDTLLIAGGGASVNGIPISGVAAYVNGTWSGYGLFQGYNWQAADPYRFRIIEGDLYAIGGFTYADGHLCNGIAKREGNEWVNVGFMDVGDPPNMQDLVEYNGELIVCGVFNIIGEGTSIARFDGSEWHTLGPGIIGSFGGAGRSMAVYQGELYLSGAIDGAVNPGHGIMRWDGTQFLPVGTGFQDIDGLQNYLIGALDMKVRDGLLWASGTFSYAGNQATPGIAIWDGTSWCALPPGPTPEVNAFEFFHDTLFMGNHDVLYGQQDVPAVRFNGNLAEAATCAWSVGVQEEAVQLDQSLGARFGGDGRLYLSGLPDGAVTVRVMNMLGQLVHSAGINTGPDQQIVLEVPTSPGQVLLVAVDGHGAVRTVRLE